MKGSAKRKPLALHIHDPKQHLTKADKKERAESEITMGKVSFTAPEAIKKSPAALLKWKEITKIYRESGLCLVSSTDNGVLARYCLLYSDYLELVEQRRIISSLDFPQEDVSELLALTSEEFGVLRARRLWGLIDYFTSLDGVLKLDKAINAKAKSVTDVEDRIFLNPASKVRTLPLKRKPKEKDELGEAGFDV